VVVDLRRWWVVLNWVFESECVRGNSIICDEGCEMESVMRRSKNRGEAIWINRVFGFELELGTLEAESNRDSF
jgi:hypothetical protein